MEFDLPIKEMESLEDEITEFISLHKNIVKVENLNNGQITKEITNNYIFEITHPEGRFGLLAGYTTESDSIGIEINASSYYINRMELTLDHEYHLEHDKNGLNYHQLKFMIDKIDAFSQLVEKRYQQFLESDKKYRLLAVTGKDNFIRYAERIDTLKKALEML